MKKTILSILFILKFFLYIFSNELNDYERLYTFKILAFNKIYEIYFSNKPKGYYKYPNKYSDLIIYLTYEGNIFYEQSKYDENFTIISKIYPINLWTDNKGYIYRYKRKYGPVIEKDRIAKKYQYGYGEN